MKFDWTKIRAEYISTGISQREIAKKYSVSPAQIARRASNEGWAESRSHFASATTAKAEQKMVEKRSDELAGMFASITTASHNITQMLLEASEDKKNFRVKRKLDTKSIKNLTGALIDLVNVLRDVTESPNAVERARMERDDESAPVEVQIKYVPPPKPDMAEDTEPDAAEEDGERE